MELKLAYRVHGKTPGKSYFEIKKEHGYKEGWGETSLTEDFIRWINKMSSSDAQEAQELVYMHFYSLARELIETIANGQDESDSSVFALRSHLERFVKIIETKSPDNDPITLTLLLLSRFENSFKEENVFLPQGEAFKNKLLVTLQELAKDPEKCRKLLSAENAARMVSFLYLHHTALESISALEEKLLYTVYVKQDNEKVSKYLVGKATSPDFQSPDFWKVSTALAELIAGKYPDKLANLVRYLKDLVSTYEAIGEQSLYNESLEIIGTLYRQPVVDKIQMEQISLRELLGNLEERCEAKKMQIEAKKVLANLKEKALLITQYTQEGDIHELYTDFKDEFLAIDEDDFDGLGDIYKQIVSIERVAFGAYLKIVQEIFWWLFAIYQEEELSQTDSSKRIDQLFQRSRWVTDSDSFLDEQFEIYNDIKNRREAFESHMKNLSDGSITISESSMESWITMVIESMFEENIFIEWGGVRQSIVSKTLEKVGKIKFATMLLHATDICIMNILENPPFWLNIDNPETLVQTYIQVFEIARWILPKNEEVISILSQLYAIKKGIELLSQVEKIVSGETAEGDGNAIVHQVRSEVQQVLLRNKITVAKLSLEILKIINGAWPKHFPKTKHLLIAKIS